ncbi:MAG: hypothetical protein Q9165_008263 [Trypethelium subeluteriae]
MEETLRTLVDSLDVALGLLKGDSDVHAQLLAKLHSQKELPDREISALAYKAIDRLHETEQLLEPGPLVLADHFLAVELRIPDLVRKGPLALRDLATVCKARPDRLRQVLRKLYNNGIFHYEAATDSISNNSTSELLTSDHWTQWRNWVDLYGNVFYDMARGIPASCREQATRTPAQIEFDTDKDMFTYFTDQGWLGRLHKTLGGGAIAMAPGILEDYPWEEVASDTILDVGGGDGALVALLLRRYRQMRGGILDLPEVIERARNNFRNADGIYADVGNRVSDSMLVVGDFLEEVPSSKVYTMKWCLHDWDDTKAIKVMRNIRKAVQKGPNSKLIIMESLLTDGRMGRLSRYADLNLMMAAGGQERTEADWKRLAGLTGWVLNRVLNLRNAWPCALEFVPAWTGSDSENAAFPNFASEAFSKGIPINGIEERGYSKPSYACGSRIASTMSFLESWDPSKGEPYFRSAPDAGFMSQNFKWTDHDVTVTDARPHKDEFSLDKNGFQYINDDEGLSDELLTALRSGNKNLITEKYYPKVEAIVKTVTKASRVIIFDHTLRKRRPELQSGENPDGKEQPATVVHCDQGPRGAVRRLRQIIDDEEEAERILQSRVRIVNAWQPLNGPVVDWPLAQMDFKSLSSASSHPCNLWRHQYEDRGQTMTFTYDDSQRWFYLDQHRTDEITLIKIWDSATNGVAHVCPHTAFKHPLTSPDAEPRESIEVRCLILDAPGAKDLPEVSR